MSQYAKPLLLTKEQVCEALGISRVTLWRWVESGIFPKPMQLGPRRIVWRPSAVDLFLENLEREANSEKIEA